MASSPSPALARFLAPFRKLFGGGAAAPSVGAREAADLAKRERALIVDVREDREWRTGHVPAARHVPLGEIEARLAEIPRDRPVIVICASGVRSRAAARTLARNGYQNVRNLRGGMMAWRGAGLPVQR